MNIRRIFPLMIILLIGFTGCNKKISVTEQIYEHLEESVKLEQDYAEYQQEIFNLEKEEQEIYQKITDLSQDELDEIKALAKQAIDIINEREKLITQERESLEASKEEFLKVEPLISKLEDEMKENAESMFDKMIERYHTYDLLYDAYLETLRLEKEFYEMYQNENTDLDETSKHIDKLNESYDFVLENHKSYNDATREYNELKKEFYLSTDLDIIYE